MTETAELPAAPATDEETEQPPTPGDDEQEPQEQTDEPDELGGPASPAMSDKDLERAIAKLESEATRHANRISEIMGDDAQALIPCELCEPATPGFCWPAPPDEARRERVLEALGLGAQGERNPDPEAVTCDLCDGWGETLTGSKVENQRTRPCPKCGANGWTTAQQRQEWASAESARAGARDAANAHPAAAPPASSLPATDAWTRPVGHEFYGVNPVYMTAEQRARDWPAAA